MNRVLVWMVILGCLATGWRGWGQVPDSHATLVASISAVNSGLAHGDCHDLRAKHKVCVTESVATGDGWHVMLTKISEVTDQAKPCVFISEMDINLAGLDPTYVMPMDDWMGASVKMTTTDSRDTLVGTGHGVPETCHMTSGGHWLSLNFRDAAARDVGLKALRDSVAMAGGKASIFSGEQLGAGASLEATTDWLKGFLEIATSGATEVWGKMNVTRATAVRSARRLYAWCWI